MRISSDAREQTVVHKPTLEPISMAGHGWRRSLLYIKRALGAEIPICILRYGTSEPLDTLFPYFT